VLKETLSGDSYTQSTIGSGLDAPTGVTVDGSGNVYISDPIRNIVVKEAPSGGDLEQIKFLLGHSSIQTTERYLGSQQDIAVAVNDNLGL
jgi:hypothetical protein